MKSAVASKGTSGRHQIRNSNNSSPLSDNSPNTNTFSGMKLFSDNRYLKWAQVILKGRK